VPSFGACWKLGSLGQGCSATCGGAQFADPALTVALGSSSELVQALCEHETLETPNRHAEAFDRTCEPPANSRFFTARFLYFPEVRSWDCFPGESIEDIAPVFRSPCACTEPLPPSPYAEYAAQLCASTGCAALSSLAFGFCLALCLLCFLCFCCRRQPSYYGDYGEHGGRPKGEGGSAGGEIYGYSSRSYRGSGGFDENYGVKGPLGSPDCLRLQIRLQHCWRELSYHARRRCSCWSLQFRLQRYGSELVYQAGRCYRGCCRYVGGLGPYGYRSSYYGDQLEERWRGTLSSPRGGTHRRSPEGAYPSSYPGSYPGSYSGSYASTPRHPRSPHRSGPHACGHPFSGAEVREAFARFDANRSGRLDHTELRAALRAFGLDVDSQQATAILQQYDADGNGLLDVDEFGSLVRRLSGLGSPSAAAAKTPGHAVRSTPSTPPRVVWTGREQRSKPDLDAGGSTLRSFEERPRERPREHNACPRPYNAFRDRQPTLQTVGGGTIWGGAGPPPPGKQKPPQQTFFPPATRAPSGYSNAQHEQMSMH
jgi:hypothetical protein